MTERTVRASELAEFVFCQRAWWYHRQGLPSSERQALAKGRGWHESLARRNLAAIRMAAIGRALAFAGAVLLILYAVYQLVR